MQPGDIVMIYQDPITQKDPEGRATLVRQISPDEGDGLSRWVVRFWDDPEACYVRTIYVDPLCDGCGLKKVNAATDYD